MKRMDFMTSRLALVTGATGYVGGQVAAELVERGWRVRVLSRSEKKVRALPWGEHVEVVEGDASEASDVARAMEDVDVAWYLLHSMSTSDDFVSEEKEMASTFADAARDAGVSRIVYLGGLHPDDEDVEQLSDHLRSRVEVGHVLIDSGVPTAALQAGVVIGDESSSSIMLRNLSERLPGAIAPKWIKNRIQPIAVADAVHYLVGAADLPADVSRTFDIGGPEPMPYGDMMKRYAKATKRWLPRIVGTAPVTTAGLAGHWIGLVTPVSSSLAAPLIGSLQHDTVVHERDLDDLVGAPPGGHTTFEDAVRAAVKDLDTSRWVRTLGLTSAAVAATAVAGSLLTDPKSAWYRTLRKPAIQPPPAAFPVVWSALYTDLALISSLTIADLAETGRTKEQRAYIAALAANLALNVGWNGTFFAAKKLRPAVLEAAALAASSADLVRRAHKASPEKGVVLAPYAAWTGFATVLSAVIARRNPGR